MRKLALSLAACTSLTACTVLDASSDAADAAAGPVDSAWLASVLDAHNAYRTARGLPSLGWSTSAAAHAQSWADHLASTDTFEHSQAPDRVNEGENLWKGTAGAYTTREMVGAWGDEEKYFAYGTFPDVSTTGDWHDVGHYTQLVWRDTTSVGCAIATGHGADVLVCRYAPPGNYIGQRPY